MLISIFELYLPLFSTNVLFLLTSCYWYQLGVTKVICAAIISLYTMFHKKKRPPT